MNKQMTLAAAVVALLAIPVGAANWMSYGTSEPDTVLDDPSLMWTDPPAAGQVRVYFNAYTTMLAGTTGSGFNPNVGALGTQFETFGTETNYAVLGIWTDCNGDGYIGMAETAAREYRSELLLDSSACPSAGGNNLPGGANTASGNWPATGKNNFAGWVTELIPIISGTNAGDKRTIKDYDAAIWGEFGRPDEPSTAVGGSCAITPFPRTNTQTTGGLLTYTDCRSGVLDAWNTAVDAAGDPAGLRFSDDDDGRTGTLGGFSTLGDSSSDNAIVKAQDCDQAVLVPTSVPDQDPSMGIRPPSTNVNPDGSVAGTVNYTIESTPLPKRQEDANRGAESTSNCDTSDDFGEEPYSFVESRDFTSVSNSDKREAQWNFEPSGMSRGGLPLGGLTGNGGAPSDAGLEPFNAVCTLCQESEWFGGSTLVKGPFAVAQTRGTVAGGDFQADVDEGRWLTFYATVGSTTTSLGAITPGGSGVYGSAQCGPNTSGVHNGWNCDKDLWNRNAGGDALPDPYNSLAYPGKPYSMRDVDCQDGGIGTTGLGVQPAFFGPSPCIAG